MRHLAALFLPLFISAAHAVSTKMVGWYPCSTTSYDSELAPNASPKLDAQCAMIKAPLCYDGVCTAQGNISTIDVFVKRIQARSTFGSDAMNVWFLQGGPGAASAAMESAMSTLFQIFQGRINVYTMDHRGTGRSTKLDCVAAQALTSGSPFGTLLAPSEVAACATDLATKYGGTDYAAFSVTSAAKDLNYFIANLQDSSAPTFVYGVSYGSSLVERLMHLSTPGIQGYILDGVSTTSGASPSEFEYFSMWDTDYGLTGEYFMSFCAQDVSNCGRYFSKTSLSDTLKNVLKTFDANDNRCSNVLGKTILSSLSSLLGSATLTSPGDLLRMILGVLLADASTRVLIPVLAYRLNRCNGDDVKSFRHFIQVLVSQQSSNYEDSAYRSNLLYRLIVYSEFWESPAPSYDTLLQRFHNASIAGGTQNDAGAYCAMTKDPSDSCKSFAKSATYDAPALTYKKDTYWNVAAELPNNVSVLLMSGKMDPQTPHKYAERLLGAIKAKNKQLVAFDTATHGTLWSTSMGDDSSPTCGMRILASYVSQEGDLSAMSTSCMSSMPPLDWQVSSSLARQVFNTTSAFDGEFVGVDTVSESSGSSSSKYKTTFFILIPVCIVIIVVAAVFYVKWRRTAKDAIPIADTPVYESSV